MKKFLLVLTLSLVFLLVLTLSLVLGVSLCGCLQWLEIPDEHYSQASAELINENASDNAHVR